MDIWTYDTCPRGCIYCYASANKAIARHAVDRHDLDSAFLGYRKAQSTAWVVELRPPPGDACMMVDRLRFHR